MIDVTLISNDFDAHVFVLQTVDYGAGDLDLAITDLNHKSVYVLTE